LYHWQRTLNQATKSSFYLYRWHGWQNDYVKNPVVLIVGREITEPTSVRGPTFGIGRTYAHAITRAGGIPIILPPIIDLHDQLETLLSRCDAIVLHGGGDIDPKHYGQSPTTSALYGINANHDEIEIAVARHALAEDIPMLAICRGLQVVNVAHGGTLIQDLGTEDHRQKYHSVDLIPDSKLARAVGASRAEACHSFHHQAVDVVGHGFVVVGTASDGTIEAIESTTATWCVAVQWHPEDSAATDQQQQNIFDTLIKVSK
jgi:putative glutamine amidotransferase